VLCLPAHPPPARARVRVCLQNMYFSPELNAATEKLIAHAHKNSIILGLFLFGCAASSAVAHNVARADQMEFTHRDRERERERERERGARLLSGHLLALPSDGRQLTGSSGSLCCDMLTA
jgi:hypothetical protein